MSRVQVPLHIARLVTRLVVDYFTSRRIVVDYFSYAARPGASARRAAHRRLLRLRRASECPGMSHGLLRVSSSTTSPTRRVRVPRHVARLVARLLVNYFTSCVSSSTTLPTPRVQMPRHVTRLVAWLIVEYFALRRLVVDYFVYAVRPAASARRRPCAVSSLDFLSVGRTGSHRVPSHCISRCDYSSSGLHWLYYSYVVHPDASSRCSNSLRSVALALIVCPVTASRGTTTRRSVAPALLHLCRASRRVVSPVDFSSVGRTGSCGAPNHFVSRLDFTVA
jgi:hypothetical protein